LERSKQYFNTLWQWSGCYNNAYRKQQHKRKPLTTFAGKYILFTINYGVYISSIVATPFYGLVYYQDTELFSNQLGDVFFQFLFHSQCYNSS